MHSTLSYGENLVVASSKNALDQMVAMWYNEVCTYNFSSPGFSESTGHFTQVVWAGTSLVGCAVVAAASCPNGIIDPDNGHVFLTSSMSMLVCEYYAPGNTGLSSAYASNVPAPLVPPSTCGAGYSAQAHGYGF